MLKPEEIARIEAMKANGTPYLKNFDEEYAKLSPEEKAEDAARMLRILSGKTHEVITAVTIRDCSHHETFSDTTAVRFKELTEKEISYYIGKYRPFDKAGAYGVQEWIGYIGIDSIKGSFYTVMGLPVHLLYSHLEDFMTYRPL